MPVAQAPATEMCGSEPRLGSAKPRAVQVRRELAVPDPRAHGDGLPLRVQLDSAGGSAASETESPAVSAIALKEWPVPSARIRVAAARPAPAARRTLDGLWKRAAL